MGKLFDSATGMVRKTLATSVLAATTAVSGAANNALDFVIHPASAADTFPAAVSNVAATTQQVFDEVRKNLPTQDVKDFNDLSPEGKNSVAFFYNNLKEVKNTKNLSHALQQITYLQLGYEINKKALSDLQEKGRISGEGIEDPSDLIGTLLGIPDCQTLLSPNTQLGQVFGQFRTHAEWTFQQAKTLQTKLHSTDSAVVKQAKLELAAAKKALAESEKRLATSQQRLSTAIVRDVTADRDGRKLSVIATGLK